MKKGIVMAGKSKADLGEYTEEFLAKFVDYMAAANSLEKCNAGAIQFIMKKNGEKEYSEKEIKTIWSLIKLNLSKKDQEDEFLAGLTKKSVIAELNEMFKSRQASIKDKMDILSKLEKYNNWLDSSDAEEIIKSNNALIDTILKTFNQSEMEYLAFSFVEPEVSAVQSVENDDDDENESIIHEIEVV